jgi:hypothetical protein
MSVGARSSFAASDEPAASFSRPSASGPRTRKRHGLVRWWFGAQRASSSSSSSTAAGMGSGPNDLCVRRVRMTVSMSGTGGSLSVRIDSAATEPVEHLPVV